jgi:hypothetical protein
MARSFNPAHFFDLEDPRDSQRLTNPMLALERLDGLVMIDEIQRMPQIFPILRVLADREDRPGRRFLVLGSARPEIVRGISESLAGRVAFIDLGGFRVDDPGIDPQERLWLRGGFPRSFLADDDSTSLAWRSDFARSLWERDLPSLGLALPPGEIRRFWTLLSHYHGQIVNYAEIGRTLGASDTTLRRWIAILEGISIVRTQQPWFEYAGKRTLKNPKLFFYDSGLYHFFQGINSLADLESHPRLGASWEGFALEEIRKALGSDGRDLYFWATHGDAELDLFYTRGGKRIGCEFKYADAPTFTRSMGIAMSDLSLDSLYVIVPAGTRYKLRESVEVLPLAQAVEELR